MLAARAPVDAAQLTVSGDRTAQLRDVETGRAVVRPLPHAGRFYPIEISRDRSRILTASAYHTAIVRYAATGETAGLPMHHDDVIRAAHFSPDGTQVVTGSPDHTARKCAVVRATPAEAPDRAALAEAVAGYRFDAGDAILAIVDRAD